MTREEIKGIQKEKHIQVFLIPDDIFIHKTQQRLHHKTFRFNEYFSIQVEGYKIHVQDQWISYTPTTTC